LATKSRIPHDIVAEELILGATMLKPEQISEIAPDLDESDFYSTRHAAVWAAFRQMWEVEGIKPDAITLTHATNLRLGPNSVDPSYLTGLLANCVIPNRSHVEILKSAKAGRDIISNCQEALSSVSAGADPYEIAEEMDHFVSTIGQSSADPESMTLWELSEIKESAAPVIIPGILKRDWCALIVAAEGAGKAVLMRSMAMATAQGVHPFTHEPIEPHRVLVVDAENPLEAIVNPGIILETTLMNTVPDYDETRFRVWRQKRGIDVRNRQDRANFIREIKFQKPELVCIGPLNKIHRAKGGERYEDTAGEVIDILDDLRAKFEFALVVEHHAPKGEGGAKRQLVPMGSQRWMGWPELGIGLRENELVSTTNDVEQFRKPRLVSHWPDHILRDPRYVISGVWDDGRPGF
jgi:replicative DNA helicase